MIPLGIVFGQKQNRTKREQEKGRRVKVLAISEDLLLSFFRGETSYKITENPLPVDAKIIGVSYEPQNQIVNLVLESAEYAPVPKGEPMPYVDIPIGQDL